VGEPGQGRFGDARWAVVRIRLGVFTLSWNNLAMIAFPPGDLGSCGLHQIISSRIPGIKSRISGKVVSRCDLRFRGGSV
jgi:hypothetical protein